MPLRRPESYLTSVIGRGGLGRGGVVTPGGGGGGGGFVPSRISTYHKGLWPALSRAAGGLWQDTGKTVPATANGDPIRVAVDPFGKQDATAPSDATRPVLTDEGSGVWSAVSNGTSTHMTFTNFTPAVFSAYGAFDVGTTTGNYLIIGGRDSAAGGTVARWFNDTFVVVGDPGAVILATGVTALSAGRHVWRVRRESGGASYFKLDGAAEVSMGASTTAVSFNAWMTALVGTIFNPANNKFIAGALFNGAVTPAEDAQMFTFMDTQAGL